MARFPALFDTNVLFGSILNDLILRLAENGLFRPLWSGLILQELRENLVEHGISQERANKRIVAMMSQFPDALVTGFEGLISQMSNEEKDRHVLAAAVRANCEVLVTFNTRDFPAESVSGYDIEVVNPDKFLMDQLDLYPDATLDAIGQLVKDYGNPPIDINGLLERLALSGVPEFAHSVESRLNANGLSK